MLQQGVQTDRANFLQEAAGQAGQTPVQRVQPAGSDTEDQYNRWATDTCLQHLAVQAALVLKV